MAMTVIATVIFVLTRFDTGWTSLASFENRNNSLVWLHAKLRREVGQDVLDYVFRSAELFLGI